MEMTLHVDLSAKKIAELVDQLPAREFVKMKGLIETKARALQGRDSLGPSRVSS